MATLLAGWPETVLGLTVNRLCASGLNAVAIAGRSIKAGEADLCIAGGVESMSRAPFVIPKAEIAFDRSSQLADTTLGWRFVHPKMQEAFGTDTMPETGENVAEEFGIAREDQDAFAYRSQQRTKAAKARGFFDGEIVPVTIPKRKDNPVLVRDDEHPRPETSLEGLAKIRPFVKSNGTITAGNASGVNDGACALFVASDAAISKHALQPLARIVRSVSMGVAPRVMGIGPARAVKRLLEKTNLSLDEVDVIELNEAFASQALAVTRSLDLPDDAAQVNPNGGAIALGHPLGMSGARLVGTAARQLKATNGRYAICTMGVGVGQGVAMLWERPK